MNSLKTLLCEAVDNVLIAGSVMFLLIAFLGAYAEPKASFLPLVLGAACYLWALSKDKGD